MPPAYAPTYAPPPPGFGNDPNPFGNAPAQIGGSEKKPASGIEYLFDEHRIEYLAWGLVIFLMGFGIILLAIDTAVTRDLLLIAGPLVVGGILMFSSFLQRIVFGYSVSLITWAMAVGASAFGLTQAIAAVTDTRSGEYLQNQVLYFLGLLVIISGMVIIMQVFRSPND
jgi:cytochrome b subunit of formate dehydrogenase